MNRYNFDADLDVRVIFMYAYFYIMAGFVFVSFCFRARYLSFKHLIIDRGGCHALGRVCLLYLDHLVPLLIWIFTSCAFFIIWEVLLTAR